jgi:hypothetical protein
MSIRPFLVGRSEAETYKLMGTRFVLELMDDAAVEGCPSEISKAWQTIASWINWSGGELSPEQTQMISEGWIAYLAIGLAPSIKLQSNFDNMAECLKDQSYALPPKKIMDVFDTLLASDVEISEKRLADYAAERKELEKIFKDLTVKRKNWWRDQHPMVRKWAFITLIWMIIVLSYFHIFDPFDVGGWNGLSDEEFNRVITVACLPIFGGLVYKAYLKWVA